MPIISLFYGIIIRMFFRDNDKHKMPHMHAFYGEYEAVFTLGGEIIAGDFQDRPPSLELWTTSFTEKINFSPA